MVMVMVMDVRAVKLREAGALILAAAAVEEEEERIAHPRYLALPLTIQTIDLRIMGNIIHMDRVRRGPKRGPPVERREDRYVGIGYTQQLDICLFPFAGV
jgi:hypothetical protein